MNSNILNDARKRQVYFEEAAILGFTEDILRRLDELGITKAQLAGRLAVDRAYVTKLIGGNNNFTLRTMVKVARALQSKLRVQLVEEEGTDGSWTEIPAKPMVATMPSSVPEQSGQYSDHPAVRTPAIVTTAPLVDVTCTYST